jgi:hypothetical protein
MKFPLAELTEYYIQCSGENPLVNQVSEIGHHIESMRSVTRQLKKDGMARYDKSVVSLDPGSPQ